MALLAVLGMASGDIFAASDTPRQKQRQKAQQPVTQPAAVTPVPVPAPPPPEGAARDTHAPQPVDQPAVAIPGRPAATIVDSRDASSVLGREVRSAADENMGRIVDMLVDQSGQVRAAIIDFGGFLGVGSRKIAVDWKALRFSPGKERNRVILEMAREQVRAAPEYQEGKPIFVLSAVAGTEAVRYTTGSPGR